MEHTITHGPSFALGTLELTSRESVTVEAGSLVGMSDGLRVRTRIGGNRGGGFTGVFRFFTALVRKLLGGRTLFVNTCSAREGATGKLLVAPSLAGDIVHLELDGDRGLVVQGGSYLASGEGVAVKTRFGGLKGLFSSEGTFWVRCGGKGDIWISAYGAVHEIEVDGSAEVDTGHVVAFDDSLDFQVRGSSSLKAALLTGEGLTAHFRGRGRVLIQSRNLGGTLHWITPKLYE